MLLYPIKTQGNGKSYIVDAPMKVRLRKKVLKLPAGLWAVKQSEYPEDTLCTGEGIRIIADEEWEKHFV